MASTSQQTKVEVKLTTTEILSELLGLPVDEYTPEQIQSEFFKLMEDPTNI